MDVQQSNDRNEFHHIQKYDQSSKTRFFSLIPFMAYHVNLPTIRALYFFGSYRRVIHFKFPRNLTCFTYASFLIMSNNQAYHCFATAKRYSKNAYLLKKIDMEAPRNGKNMSNIARRRRQHRKPHNWHSS